MKMQLGGGNLPATQLAGRQMVAVTINEVSLTIPELFGILGTAFGIALFLGGFVLRNFLALNTLQNRLDNADAEKILIKAAYDQSSIDIKVEVKGLKKSMGRAERLLERIVMKIDPNASLESRAEDD